MPEGDQVATAEAPRTRQGLAEDLRSLGVEPGETLLVHSSLSALGWVCGGAEAVVQALVDAVGPEGTVVVPTHTSGNSEPSRWENPPVPEHWWPAIREHMPAYHPATTPTRGMGAVPECLRTFPGAARSAHPSHSFAALGARAAWVVADHALEQAMGEASPLGRLYQADARILLLGVGWESCTALHLAEHRAGTQGTLEEGCARQVDGAREWVRYQGLAYDEGDFLQVGSAIEAEVELASGWVGAGVGRRMSLRRVVDAGAEEIRRRRRP